MKTIVTAQHFIDAIHGDKNGFFHDYTAKAFDALIAQIYAQGRKDGLREMDEVKEDFEKSRSMFAETKDEIRFMGRAVNRYVALRQEYAS